MKRDLEDHIAAGRAASAWPGDAAPRLRDRPELVAACDPYGPQAEAMREVRSRLLMGLLAPGQPRRALAIVSPQRGDGKSFFAANLAVVLSQLGSRTLLIDANLRDPRQHRVFRVDDRYGLGDVLSGRRQGPLDPVRDLPDLHVLPVGTPPANPGELVQRAAFREHLAGWVRSYDFVLVDTSAACFGSDYAVIAASCGGALVLGRQGRTRLATLQEMLGALAGARAGIAGVVMNRH